MMSKNLFTRVLRLRKKYRYLINKAIVKLKNKVFRNLTRCVIEKFNGFEILRKMNEGNIKHQFRPINIVYHPKNHYKEIINCCSIKSLHEAYRTTLNSNNTTNAYRC